MYLIPKNAKWLKWSFKKSFKTKKDAELKKKTVLWLLIKSFKNFNDIDGCMNNCTVDINDK